MNLIGLSLFFVEKCQLVDDNIICETFSDNRCFVSRLLNHNFKVVQFSKSNKEVIVLFYKNRKLSQKEELELERLCHFYEKLS